MGNTITTSAKIALVLLFALASLVALAPASKAGLEGNCELGEVCLFRDLNFNGGIAQFTGNDSNYYGNSYGFCSGACGLNDSATSVDNDGNFCDSRHDEHWSYGGGHFTLPLGDAKSDLNTNGTNNRLTSHKWIC